MFDGVVTNRNPLRDNSTRIEESFYGTRGDSLVDGVNAEISTKLTLIRRPGLSVYNSATVSAVNRFYANHLFNSQTEKIQVLADTSTGGTHGTGQILDVTTNGSASVLFNKSAGAGSTYFQSVGNILYFSDGVDSKKLVGSLLSWTPATAYTAGQYLIDPNGNIQINIGSQTATITNIQIASGVLTLFFSSTTPLDVPNGTEINLSGLTTVPSLNGSTITVSGSANSFQLTAPTAASPQSFAAETGSATTGTSISGMTQPSWMLSLNAVTQDGTAQWLNRGPQIENWGIVAPSAAPLVTQAPAPSIYPPWAMDTWYSPYFVIVIAGVVYQLTTAGTTAGSMPSFNPTKGATTADGTAVWTSLGTDAWQANTAYALGSVIQTTFTYYITKGVSIPYPPYYELQQYPVTVTLGFRATTAGTSGAVQPAWTNGNNTTVNDNTVVWTNVGSPPGWPGATQILSLATQVLDSNGNIEAAQQTAESSGTAPTWATTTGALTPDAFQIWLNTGPYSAKNTGDWIYAYSYVNTVTDAVSTASPESTPILVSLNNLAIIQGVGSADPQVDTIFLWRTVQGGSQLFYLDEIPNPGAGQNWIYTDTTPDTGLNELIEAPIDDQNNPPPTGLSALTYHLGLIFGAVNNSVYYSDGPDTTSGNGNEAWSPSNVFVFPDTVTRLFPSSVGLLVFTVSDIYLIQGLNTSASPLFSTPFLQNIGLVSYDAFAVNGGIVYLYTSDNQMISLDPSSGVSEVGFPIGDQFGPGFGTGTFTPSSTQVTWHVAGSVDKGLYVSDFSGTWWRLCPTPAPESGLTWSPKAQPVGGFSAVQSIEVVPGTHKLLVGPRTSGPILERNYSVYTDYGSAYNAYAILGSLVLAQPGQFALVESITTDSVLIGSPISLAVQLDEIAPLSSGYFEPLYASESTRDPTELPPSNSLYAQRFYLSNTQQPAICRHLQIQINWGEDVVKNELLAISLFGAYDQEK